MLELKYLLEEKERLTKSLRKRNYSQEDMEIIQEINNVDRLRKETQTQADELKASFNKLSSEIGQLYKAGKREEAEILKEKNLVLKDKIKFLNEKLKNTETKKEELLISLPNVLHECVPSGKGEEENEVMKEDLTFMPELGDEALAHWDLASRYGLIDFETGAKVTGSGFPFYRGDGARLQRALISFFLEEGRKQGYTEFQAPLLVNEATARGTGQLPDKDGQMYFVERDNLYLIPTAEVPLTNIFRDEIIKEEHLPVKLTGYTPCFRREAGSYGSDVKGLNRLHQFDKVEIVQIVPPKNSYAVLNQMVDYVESLVRKLELPYRILRLCGGDTSFASALTYDFEIFSAAQEKWLEVSSVSNFESFQSNRMNLRIKSGNDKPHLAHTLNGSALALPRIFAALLENKQEENKIVLPEVLHQYMGSSEILLDQNPIV